jgi:hypothetical protein
VRELADRHAGPRIADMVVVATQDRFHYDDQEPPAGGQVAHFLVPAARVWDDVVYTCQNQRIFCSKDCVAIWLNESGHQRSSVLELPTLWRLAAGWYARRLERGDVRREPSAAAEYLQYRTLGHVFGLTSR